jgi:hypothetical protein
METKTVVLDEGKHPLEMWWGPEKRPNIDYLSVVAFKPNVLDISIQFFIYCFMQHHSQDFYFQCYIEYVLIM